MSVCVGGVTNIPPPHAPDGGERGGGGGVRGPVSRLQIQTARLVRAAGTTHPIPTWMCVF